MFIKLHHRRSGIGLLALILFCLAIVAIGSALAYFIWRLSQILHRKSPPPGGGGGTNTTEYVDFDYIPPNNGPVTFPQFQFQSGMQMAKDGTTDNPLGSGYIVIERSTNLVDWIPVHTNNWGQQVNDFEDTNPPAPAVFYRQYIHFP